MNIIKDKLTTLHQFQIILIFIFERILKKKFITSSTLSLIMISMLSLFECITGSSSLSLEERKIIAIVYWIFHVSNFLRLFLMSFKYSVILLKSSSIHSVYSITFTAIFHIFVTPKITYSYWFITIFFFFMLKKISYISKY